MNPTRMYPTRNSRSFKSGYWMKPAIHRVRRDEGGGGDILLGPLQINWYGKGWRIYLTWPRLRRWEFGG